MSEQGFTVLWLSLLVLGLVYLSIGYRLSYLKAHQHRLMRHHQEGFAGKFLKDYQPRTTIHSIINGLVTRPRKAFVSGAIITTQKVFPDVSFWQASPDFDVMRTKTDAIIIRAGQNIWVDKEFARNYSEAKSVGMKRGVYYFYDDRQSPGAQASILINLLKNDLPELSVFVDWETSYGGAFGGLKNVVAMMEALERALPTVRVGLYTGYWWFVEHSNAVANFAQYNYLKSKPLWIAWYTPDPLEVRIPAPWTALMHWQYGTPSSAGWGVGSKEIDLNFFNGTEQQFYTRYGVTIVTPPTEEIMTVTYTGKVKDAALTPANVRAQADTSAVKAGELLPGTSFTAQGLKANADGYDWLNIVTPLLGWIAITSNIEHAAVAVTQTNVFMIRLDLQLTADVNGKRYAYHLQEDLPMVEVQG